MYGPDYGHEELTQCTGTAADDDDGSSIDISSELKRQPRRPMQVIMTLIAKAFSTPAIVRKYVV
jgi:hypothetical protein